MVKKTSKKKKIQVVESVEEFIKRGGTINRLPPVEVIEDPFTIKPKHQFTSDLLSLGEAEFFFGENRAKKSNKNTEKFFSMLETSKVPKHLVDIIKNEVPTSEK